MTKKVVLVNGNPESGENSLNLFSAELNKELKKNGITTKHHILSEKQIKSCIGCWDCWWKTPGVCRQKDDASEILKDIINADITVFLSPLIMGMYSAKLKIFHERLIPLLHPYIEIRNNESHHRKRYPKYPKLAFIFENRDATDEEINNVKYILDRLSLNFHSNIEYFHSIEQINPKSASHEISHI